MRSKRQGKSTKLQVKGEDDIRIKVLDKTYNEKYKHYLYYC
jgi:hypothetical protein